MNEPGPAGSVAKDAGSPPAAPPTVPRGVRWFVRAFLIAFVVCGAVGIEAWPMTGWRLFSHLREDHRTTWRAVTADTQGQETPIPFRRLPVGQRALALVMGDFSSRSPAERAAACEAWAEAVRSLGWDVREVRIYRVEWVLVPRAGPRPALPPTVTLRFSCRGGSMVPDGERELGAPG